MKKLGEITSDEIIKIVREKFEEIPEHRAKNIVIPLADALMSAFGMFSLKDTSLLAFDKRREEGDENLSQIYLVKKQPSDSQMRTIIDEVEPKHIRPTFKEIVKEVRRVGILTEYHYMGGYYLLALDGTGHFSSKKINCGGCLEKRNSKTGEVTYHHQILGAAIVHPDKKEVIPLYPEPIMKQDGIEKNDCELNAVKRFCKGLREDYPYMPFIICEDGLYPNAPHIRMLKKYHLSFIIRVKEENHSYLFNYVKKEAEKKETSWYKYEQDGVEYKFHYINKVPLNESNQDVKVNFLEYWQTQKGEVKYFTWVTDIELSEATLYAIMRGGRARWKIENETFNTLKNQGYNYEHNYGHGKNHLAVNFASLMMLAFLVDQVQQLSNSLFQQALKTIGSRKLLWERIRALFYVLSFEAMDDILRALVYGFQVKDVIINDEVALKDVIIGNAPL